MGFVKEKKLFVFMCLCLLSNFTIGQRSTVDENPVLVYYLPFNTIVFEIKYEEVKLEKGKFSEYAKTYLGITNAITNNDIRYNLISVQSFIKTTPNYQVPFTIISNFKEKPNHYVTISDNGILLGYNVDKTYIEQKKEDTLNKKNIKIIKSDEAFEYMPLSEEYIKENQNQSRAKMIADEIFRLRESQLYIASGEGEHAYGSKDAIDYAFSYLNKREKELTNLFIGKIKKNENIVRVEYKPSKSETKVLFYFNKYKGVIEPEALQTNSNENIPIKLTITTHRPASKILEQLNSKSRRKTGSEIYYNLPGYAYYKVFSNDTVYLQAESQIAQLGVPIPISEELINDKETRIYLNEHSGNIISIAR